MAKTLVLSDVLHLLRAKGGQLLCRKMSNIKLLDIDTPLVSLAEVRRFITDCMVAVGTPKNQADVIAENLALADYRGHYSHGMNRLEMYVNDVQTGICIADAEPELIKETPATAWVDGKNGLGSVIGKYCMEVAIKKAKEVGIGWVCAKGSNHYGIAGIYSLQAMKEGLMGMSFTNTSPFMTPTRAKTAALGTNPLSLGANGENNESFVLDMATTAVALGKIEIQKRKDEPIPSGWALGFDGQATVNPHEAFNAGCLSPLGGSEENSGYKGYGLGMLVEIFCGVLSGANYGSHIRKWGSTDEAANLGQCFIAIDPGCFAPGFETRMSGLMNDIHSMKPVDINKPVMVPGDPEKLHMKAVDAANGCLRYVPNQYESCQRLSEMLKIKPLQKYT